MRSVENSLKPTPPGVKPTLRDLAQAVLLFHGRGVFTDEEEARWDRMTGKRSITSTTLVEMAREALS